MGKFELDPDERVVDSHSVSLIEGGKRLPAKLTLTNRRLAVVASANMSRMAVFSLFGGLLGALIGSATAGKKATYMIARRKFASVEQGEAKLLVFHDSGEGYGHTSFAIESSDDLATWQDRMHRWVTGPDEVVAAPLPAARIVDR